MGTGHVTTSCPGKCSWGWKELVQLKHVRILSAASLTSTPRPPASPPLPPTPPPLLPSEPPPPPPSSPASVTRVSHTEVKRSTGRRDAVACNSLPSASTAATRSSSEAPAAAVLLSIATTGSNRGLWVIHSACACACVRACVRVRERSDMADAQVACQFAARGQRDTPGRLSINMTCARRGVFLQNATLQGREREQSEHST